MKKFISILILSFLFFNNLNAEDRKSELDKLFSQLKNTKDLSSAQIIENKIQKISSQSKKMLGKNRPSLVRQAINILMHYPKLILEISEDKEFNHIDDKGIDTLREKMVINEDKRYTKEYLEADKRSIANRIQIHFNDGTSTDEVEVEYPIGHKRRRKEV